MRLSGEDVGRGTFFHRHAVLHDQKRERWDEGIYKAARPHPGRPGPLPELRLGVVGGRRARLRIRLRHDRAQRARHLGEPSSATSSTAPRWCSTSSSARARPKWGRLCGLTLMLPHGYEGQGPEHSSARLERYMNNAAEHNWQICVPTTPAQIFHLLRRRAIRKVRKPLIIITPKSLLRHREAISSIEELANGSFQTVIPEVEKLDAKKVKRVVLCQGQDLLRAPRPSPREQDHRHRAGPHRAALSVPDRGPSPRRSSSSRTPREIVWGPGRAAQPGARGTGSPRASTWSTCSAPSAVCCW